MLTNRHTAVQTGPRPRPPVPINTTKRKARQPEMVFLKQMDISDKVFRPCGWIGQMFLPTVKAASKDTHRFTEKLYWKLSGKLHDYLVFLLPYRITVPSPFTSYPFFSRASVIRALTSS